MYGVEGFSFTANSPFGSPFPGSSANNGLSVDPATGRIVLGNDQTFAPGGLAALLSGREIDLNGFDIILRDGPAGAETLIRFGPGRVAVSDNGAANDAILIASALTAEMILNQLAPGSVGLITFQTGNVNGTVIKNVTGSLLVTDPTGNIFLRLDHINNQYAIGDINSRDNGLSFIVDDSNRQFVFRNGLNGVATFDMATFFVAMGDLGGAVTGLQNELDVGNQQFNVRNSALNASYAVNNNKGASGSFTTVDLKTVTVEGGIITAIV